MEYKIPWQPRTTEEGTNHERDRGERRQISTYGRSGAGRDAAPEERASSSAAKSEAARAPGQGGGIGRADALSIRAHPRSSSGPKDDRGTPRARAERPGFTRLRRSSPRALEP